MGQGFHGPILAFAGLCLFILLINRNTDASPYHVDGTENTDQFLRISTKSTNPEATEDSVESDRSDSDEWPNNDGGPRTRDRRATPWRTSTRSVIDFGDMLSDAAIVFPEDDVPRAVERSVPVCQGSTYCETVDSYPEHIVNEALQRNASLKYLAVVDEVSDIVNRFDVDDVSLCESDEQVVYVKTAMNKDNEWKYIANQQNFKQGIRVEKCRNENSPCSMVNGPGVGYKTNCIQKYVNRQLLSVQLNGSLVLDTFRFPSSCCCHLSFTGNSSPRIGFGKKAPESNETLVAMRMRK